MDTGRTRDELAEENERLRARLEESEETLRAIRHGEVDALLVSGANGDQVFTLHSAEQPYRILIEQMQEGAVTLSAEGLILYCNLRFAGMLAIPHQKLLASSVYAHVSPEHARSFAALLKQGTEQSARAEIGLQKADGMVFPTYVTVGPLPMDVEGCICMIVTDLTEQESLRRSQVEIEMLNERLRRSMTETHHRVKNSLQIIGAMVDMQVIDGKEAVALSEVKRLSTQVKTLAILHDLLTMEAKKDGQAHFVSGQAVMKKLLPLLEQSAGGRPFQSHVEEARLTSAQATGLALIANEVISNALKHGRGAVEITFVVHDERAVLEVCDDGPGFPAEFNPGQLETTGISLVENLTRWDLKGHVAYQTRPQGGAKVSVSMPLSFE